MQRTGPDPDRRNDLRFQTDRLLMEVPVESDAETLFSMIGGADRAEITATLLWDGPDRIEQTEDWIRRNQVEPYRDHGFHWVIRDRMGTLTETPGTPLGAIGTRPREEPGRADVGYWLGREHWGQGIMSEALRELLRVCFTELNNYKVEADVYTSNPRGIRLVEGVGMTREGVISKAYRKRGGFVDVCLYGIHHEDWDSRDSPE